MKRTLTFLMTLFLTMGAMWAQVTSLEGFSQDKCYTFATSSRGAWAVDAEGTLFSSTGDQGLAVDATDTRQQFAVLSVNEADYYLYSVSAKKFIKADRTLVAGPADALAIADASSQGAGRVQFRFRDVNNSYINLGGSNQMSVDWWGTIDVGNAVLVSEAGDFNAAEALAMLSNVCTVTYEFTYEGEVKYTQELVVAKGDAYPAVQPPFGTVAETPSGTVEEDVTVEVPLTVQLPFIAAADVESIDTWYYVQMHSNNKKYIQYLADQTYIEWADAEMDETAKDSYTWAFVGNVFDGFKVVNKAATIEKALQSTGGGDATMVAYAEGTQFVLAATSETSEGAQGGFCLRYPENNQYLNAQSGKVAHWGSTDAGSTFTVAIVEEEPEVPEEPTPEPEPEETVDMDLTHLVGTSKEAWHTGGGPVTIDGISLPEHYLGSTTELGDVMWQTVTGLENGKYTVELWANARYTPGRGFNSDAADGALDFTYLYANNVEISIEVYHNGDLNNGKSYKLEGVEVTDGTLKMGMTKKAAGSNWHTIQIKSLIYHAPANAALDMAKVDLQAALDAANAVEPKKDDFVAAIAAAQDVYDNSKSVEEIEAATATLKEATKLAILGNASPSNPVLTDFVVNGTFDASTAPWQSTTGAQNQALASNQQGAFTGNFFENWNPSAVTGKIYQVIENVPNGIYDLSICAFVNNFNGAVQFVYANADKVALTSGEPTAYVVRTIVENNTIEVGFEQTEAVANWFGIDNVSLTYLGEYSNDAEVNMAKANFTAAYDEFNAALTACQAQMLKVNYYEVADAADQLNAQLESTTDIEALNAMVAQLNEATASLNEINAVYAEYDVYVQKFKAAAEWSEPLTTEAAELLEYNMYGGAGMQAMSIDALKQAIEQIKADYVAYAGNAKLYDGNMFDFTYLIQNPDFEMNLDGWTGVKANRIGGEGYDGVGGIAEIGEWGASSWDASMSQAITNLPNGKYVVKAAWMSATGIQMTFAANAGETTVTGIGDQGGNIAKDGSVVEMGQGHRGWQYVEVEGLVEDGTLTIAVSSSSAAQYMWSNADAFELYYAGTVVEEPEQPVVDPNDYTSYIINADLSTGDAWNTEGTKGISGGMVKVASESAFDFNQTITLPAGQYKVTAKAAYRYTDSEQGEYDAIQAGTETHLVKLYAETSSYKYEGDVMNRWEGASDTDYANGDGSKTVNGKFVPNSSNAVLAWFNAGQYVNELVFNVQEEGAVKIGVTRVGGVSGDYTNIGAWTLTRLGDAEADPKEEEPTPDPEKPEIGDVTSKYLVNADFETPSAQIGGAINTPPGWTMTYDLGGWLDGSTRASTNPGNDASQCFNVWAGEFRNADIYQKPVLPAGKYKLTVGFYSDGDAERYAYATVGGNTIKSARPNFGSWDFVSVEFLNPTDGEVTLGAVSKGWFQIDNVTLEYLGEVNKDDIVSAYNEALEKALALMGQKMDGTASTELAAAIAAYGSLTADNSVEELESATAAISVKVAAAETSANAYAANKTAIDGMFALMNSTNVYTVEAYEAYKAKAEDFLTQYDAGTLNATVDNPVAIHGWRASVDYDDLLLSAFGVKDFDDALYINTWSTEGETDGSDFKVPFYEYWTGDGESLGVTTKTATVTGLTPGMCYSVDAWVRVRAKNGVAAADATGITLSVGEGEATDVTEGEVIGTSQFSHAVFTATGVADAEGNLTINFNVLDGNNVSWLAFKNLKYAEDLEAYEALYNLDEPIEGEWEDVTNKPNEYGWTIIDHAELLGLGDYWVATNDTRYDEERGVMEFVAGENAAASLIQEWCPFGQATYRLTGKAFHNGAVNAVMFVGDQTVEIPAAAEGATFENAEEYFTTFSIEFTCESAWGTQLNVGYSCEFDNAEDFLVVGGLKLEEKKSTTIKSIFMETIMALESLGYEVMNMEALYASQQAVMADAMPIYEAIMGGQKVLKSEVEQSIEDMQAIIAELNPVAAYYKGEFMDALYAAEDFKWTLDEASQAYADLEAAINEANDVAAVTTVAELEAKVAALEELMKLIETGIDSIEAEVETVIYDLSGRRVTEMTKGVYIVNGKKVIKK